jgi:uracil-DNA glycosylase
VRSFDDRREGEAVASARRHRDKARRLARLRARIVRDLYLDQWRDVWFFPSLDGVKGWQGTKDIMFVGLNPSTGRFPDRACLLLYGHLKRRGFAGAHLTDVIKERATGPNVSPISRDTTRMERYRRYLLEEIRILRPRLVVAMGRRTLSILTTWRLPATSLRWMPHYAARFPSPTTRRRFGKAMAEIQKAYRRPAGP